MATNNMFSPTAPDAGTLANFVQGGDTSGQGGGLFDMNSPGWNKILMGLALMDAGRYHPQPQPLMNTLAPFMQMNAQEQNQKRAMAFLGDTLKNAPSMAGMGDAPANPASAALSSAPGGMFAPTTNSVGQASPDGGSRISDPRGVAPLIYASAQKYGIDPKTAVKVAQSEGLGTFYGDGGKSGGAFQLYTGGGLGNDFQKDTGLDPLDPKNEPATIDYALSHAAQNGWGAFHGAKRVGVGQWDGINIDRNNLPGVPNASGAMAGNQGPTYAPPGAPGPTNMQLAQATPQTMTDATSPWVPTAITPDSPRGKFSFEDFQRAGIVPRNARLTAIDGVPVPQKPPNMVTVQTAAGPVTYDASQISHSPTAIVAGDTPADLKRKEQLRQQDPYLGLGGSGADAPAPAQPGPMQTAPSAQMASPQAGAVPAAPQLPAPGQPPSPQQMMQARAAMPQTPPPPSPTDVSGLATQRATAIRSVDYWTRAMVAAGFLGDQGKGVIEAAKAKIDLASKFLTQEQQKQLDLKYGPAIAGMTKQAEIGAQLGMAGYAPGTPDAQSAARNMLPDTRPEAQRNAGFAYPNNPAMQQQIVGNSIADTRPDAVKLANAAGLQGPGRNQALAGAIGGNAPTGEQKDYAAYVADQQSRGAPVQGFGEWYLDSKKAGAANVQQKVEGQGQAALVKAGVDALQQTHEAELAANKRTQLYGQMAQAMQGFTPGATAEMRLKGTSILRDLGIIQGDNVPPQEMFNQAARQIQVHVQPKGQGQVSNYERELFAQAVPNMTKSPEMLSQAIGIAKRLDDYDRQIAQIHRDVARDNNGLPNIVEAQNRIAALGPPLSASEQTALQALGQSNQGGNAAGPAGGPASTQPGNLIYDPKTRTLQPAR